jgi:hypothetical protein
MKKINAADRTPQAGCMQRIRTQNYNLGYASWAAVFPISQGGPVNTALPIAPNRKIPLPAVQLRSAHGKSLLEMILSR